MVVFFIVILFRGDKKLVLKDEDGVLVYNLFFEEVRIQRIICRINWCLVCLDEYDFKCLY